jgi:hypothetical protein
MLASSTDPHDAGRVLRRIESKNGGVGNSDRRRTNPWQRTCRRASRFFHKAVVGREKGGPPLFPRLCSRGYKSVRANDLARACRSRSLSTSPPPVWQVALEQASSPALHLPTGWYAQ